MPSTSSRFFTACLALLVSACLLLSLGAIAWAAVFALP